MNPLSTLLLLAWFHCFSSYVPLQFPGLTYPSSTGVAFNLLQIADLGHETFKQRQQRCTEYAWCQTEEDRHRLINLTIADAGFSVVFVFLLCTDWLVDVRQHRQSRLPNYYYIPSNLLTLHQP